MPPNWINRIAICRSVFSMMHFQVLRENDLSLYFVGTKHQSLTLMKRL